MVETENGFYRVELYRLQAFWSGEKILENPPEDIIEQWKKIQERNKTWVNTQ